MESELKEDVHVPIKVKIKKNKNKMITQHFYSWWAIWGPQKTMYLPSRDIFQKWFHLRGKCL